MTEGSRLQFADRPDRPWVCHSRYHHLRSVEFALLAARETGCSTGCLTDYCCYREDADGSAWLLSYSTVGQAVDDFKRWREDTYGDEND